MKRASAILIALALSGCETLGYYAQAVGGHFDLRTRARPVEEKAGIVSRFLARFGADLESGALRPVVDRVLPLGDAQQAHELVEKSDHFGKVVLKP